MAEGELWRLEVGLLGREAISRRIGRVAAGLDDWSPIWPRVAQWFYLMEQEQFGTEGRGRWPDLAESTQRERERRGFEPTHPILEATGRLLASLLGGEGHVRREEKRSIALGTRLKVGPYSLGALHQAGTWKMPPRHPIGKGGWYGTNPQLYPADAVALRRIFSEHLHRLVAGQAA